MNLLIELLFTPRLKAKVFHRVEALPKPFQQHLLSAQVGDYIRVHGSSTDMQVMLRTWIFGADGAQLQILLDDPSSALPLVED